MRAEMWTGRFIGPTAPSWWLLAGAVVLAQALFAVLLVAGESWRIFVVAAGALAAVVLLPRPRLALYVLTAVLIGQWPGNLPRYVGALAVAAAMLWVVRRRVPLVPRSGILGLVAVYVVLVGLSAVAPSTSYNIASGVVAAVSSLAVVWLCVLLVDTREAVRRMFGVMAVSGVVTAVIGLVQVVTHFEWPASTLALARTHAAGRGRAALELHGWMGVFRIDSITGTPNYLAVTMLAVMPFVLCWLMGQRTVPRRLAGVTAVGVLLAALALSFTRGGFLIAPIVLLLTIWLLSARALLPSVVTIALGIGALLIWPPFLSRVTSMIGALEGVQGEPEAGAWRLSVVPIALEMMLERPFLGVGVDQQSYNWPVSAAKLVVLGAPGSAPPVHNAYILAGIELGLGGLLVVVALLLVTTGRLYWVSQRFWRAGDREMAAWALAAFAAIVGLILAFFLYPMLSGFRYFWVLVGLTAALVRLERSLSASPPVTA